MWVWRLVLRARVEAARSVFLLTHIHTLRNIDISSTSIGIKVFCLLGSQYRRFAQLTRLSCARRSAQRSKLYVSIDILHSPCFSDLGLLWLYYFFDTAFTGFRLSRDLFTKRGIFCVGCKEAGQGRGL